jgi:hypothetical protein
MIQRTQNILFCNLFIQNKPFRDRVGEQAALFFHLLPASASPFLYSILITQLYMKRRTNVISLLWGLVSLLYMGCQPECIIGPPTKQPADGTMPYFGQGDTIRVEEYNTIAMRQGDTIRLKFPCAVTKPDSVPSGLDLSLKGNIVTLWAIREPGDGAVHKINQLPGGGSGSMVAYKLVFTGPLFQFTANVYPNTAMWPGDANNDGFRNMLDLYAIAFAKTQYKSACYRDATCSTAIAPQILSYPPQASDMGIQGIPPGWASAGTFTWKSQQVSYVHADCNLDGYINDLDALYLLAVLEPVYHTNFLTSALGSVKLNAAYEAPINGLQPEIDSRTGKFILELPFGISLAANQTITPDSIFGVVFARPVAETQQYKLHRTQMDFSSPGIFVFPLWLQKFWPNYSISYPDNDECGSASDRVLDVGVFKRDTGAWATGWGDRIGLCQVIIIDILSIAGGGPSVPLNLIQHAVNGVAFVKDGTGQYVPVATECTSDTTQIGLGALCGEVQDAVIRDGQIDGGVKTPSSDMMGWDSPDIILQDPSTLIQIPNILLENKTQISVTVRNRSCNVMKNVPVQLYWAPTSTSLSFGDFKPINGPFYIASIPAWGSAVGSTTWTPPASTTTGCRPMITLLAVLENAQVPTTTAPEKAFHDWVLGSNNVAVKSTMLISNSPSSTHPLPQCATIDIPLIVSSSSNWNLVLEQVGGDLLVPASNYGKLVVKFQNVIATAGQNMTPSPSSDFFLNLAATSGKLSLPNNSSGSFTVSFMPNNIPTPGVPPLNRKLPYAFRFSLQDGAGTSYSSSIIKFEVQ